MNNDNIYNNNKKKKIKHGSVNRPCSTAYQFILSRDILSLKKQM